MLALRGALAPWPAHIQSYKKDFALLYFFYWPFGGPALKLTPLANCLEYNTATVNYFWRQRGVRSPKRYAEPIHALNHKIYTQPPKLDQGYEKSGWIIERRILLSLSRARVDELTADRDWYHYNNDGYLVLEDCSGRYELTRKMNRFDKKVMPQQATPVITISSDTTHDSQSLPEAVLIEDQPAP